MQRSILFLGLLAFIAASIGANPILAQEPTVITSLTGDSYKGTITEITADGKVKGDGFDELGLAGLLTINRSIKPNQPTVKFIIRLAGGGQIYVNEALIEEGIVKAKSNFGDLDISVGTVRAIVYKPFGLPGAANDAIQNPSKNNDQVVVETSNRVQTVSGLVEEINNEKVRFNFNEKSRTIDRTKVIAAVMADLQEKQSAGVLATVKMKDTSTIVGSIQSLAEGKLTVGLLGDSKLVVPFGDVVSINIRSDRLVFLSDLEPKDVEYQSVVTPKKEISKDQNLAGNPISLVWNSTKKTQTYARGISAHSYTRMVFENDGFHRLASVCGIDSETGGNGDCRVIVKGDGIELWSEQISASNDPKKIDIEIDGYKEIEITVDYGKHLDMADHVSFANIRFLKTK